MLKDTHRISQKKFLCLTELKIQYHGGYVINDLNDKKVLGIFYEKELQRTSQNEFRIEKIIKRKCYKLYVKWKGYNNSFNSWINKKGILYK